jgi:hypothetical protein
MVKKRIPKKTNIRFEFSVLKNRWSSFHEVIVPFELFYFSTNQRVRTYKQSDNLSLQDSSLREREYYLINLLNKRKSFYIL